MYTVDKVCTGSQYNALFISDLFMDMIDANAFLYQSLKLDRFLQKIDEDAYDIETREPSLYEGLLPDEKSSVVTSAHRDVGALR